MSLGSDSNRWGASVENPQRLESEPRMSFVCHPIWPVIDTWSLTFKARVLFRRQDIQDRIPSVYCVVLLLKSFINCSFI